ncbi:MAG: hypothetical protein ACO1NO_13760 [Burkholderiaceae bacterium]
MRTPAGSIAQVSVFDPWRLSFRRNGYGPKAATASGPSFNRQWHYGIFGRDYTDGLEEQALRKKERPDIGGSGDIGQCHTHVFSPGLPAFARQPLAQKNLRFFNRTICRQLNVSEEVLHDQS